MVDTLSLIDSYILDNVVFLTTNYEKVENKISKHELKRTKRDEKLFYKYYYPKRMKN